MHLAARQHSKFLGTHKSLANVTENYIVVALQEPGRVCSVD